MPALFQHARNTLRFILWGKICQTITQWEEEQDQLVFNEQLETGSFHGRFPIDDLSRQMMLEFQKQGNVLPYYGAGGQQGAAAYSLKKNRRGIQIQIENTVTKSTAEFFIPTRPWLLDSPLSQIQVRLQLYFRRRKIPRPFMILPIEDQTYRNLQTWEHWNPREAGTDRYLYHFGRVSLGNGFACQVTDTLSGQTRDITPYDLW